MSLIDERKIRNIGLIVWVGLIALAVWLLPTPKKAKVEIPAEHGKCDAPGSRFGVFGSMRWRCSQEGEWVIDSEAMKRRAEIEKSRHDLYWALRTRVLTAEEMKRVEELGIHLVIESETTFRESEKQAEFNAALLQQFRLRIAEEQRAQRKGSK